MIKNASGSKFNSCVVFYFFTFQFVKCLEFWKKYKKMQWEVTIFKLKMARVTREIIYKQEEQFR